MTTNVQFVLTDAGVKRIKHASELCAVADDLDFAMLMFLVGECEDLIERLGLSFEFDDDDE